MEDVSGPDRFGGFLLRLLVSMATSVVLTAAVGCRPQSC